MKKQTKIVSWILQIVIIALVLPPAIAKLSGDPGAIKIFTELKMEPNGRYLIGVLELVAVVLLLIPVSVVYGASLSAGLMAGAVVGHISKLGFEGQMGMMAGMAAMSFAFSLSILFLRRAQLPIVHRMFSKQ